MKYVVFLGDGMADTPVEALGGKTPLMVADKPNIDSLAAKSELGTAKTVPDGMKPGSDTANLSVLGYDPRTCYSGRSPLEALSMGIDMEKDDLAIRCNLVTLSSEEEAYEDKTMIDYSAGEISTEEARELIASVESELGTDTLAFYAGLSYRHCLIVHHAEPAEELTPPHDITGKPIAEHLPTGKLGELFLDLQKKSYEILKDHPINLARIEQGKNPANSIWLWGEGTKPALPDFKEKNGVSGAVISAVDLLKGIGKGANMKVIEVEGATGNIDTDFAAKGKAAIEAFKSGVDYVYIHVEAPDESGHQGNLEDKIKSIEKIDADIVGPVVSYLRESGEPFRALVCPDHPTPLATRTHSPEPIPYLLYKSDAETDSGVTTYDEETAKSTGIYEEYAFKLIDRLLAPAEEPSNALTPDLVTDGEEIISEKVAEESESSEEPAAENSEENEKEEKEEVKAEENADAPEDQKPKKKGGFGAFFKKHLGIFIALIALIVVAGGLTAGHFIATYHIAMIRSSKDLSEALSKKQITTLAFKKDVTIEGDLLLDRPVDFDLGKRTLTVNGTLSVSVGKDVSIGTKKNGKYGKGGMIKATAFQAVGSKTLRLYSDLYADNATIAANEFVCAGSLLWGDFDITSQEMTLCGSSEGELILSSDTTLSVYGSSKASIVGGKTVSVFKGAEAYEIKGAAVCYVYEGSNVSSVKNAGEYYFVKKLAKPEKISVLQEGDDFYCYISEVIDAKAFNVSINGKEGPVVQTNGGPVKFKLEGLVPGKQTLSVVATAANDPRFTDSDAASYSFNFSTKLSSPTLSVSEEEGVVYLTIGAVKYAEQYEYYIDGAKYVTPMTDLKIDITEKIAQGGVHIIEGIAKSNDKFFTESNKVMTSHVTYVTLSAPEINGTKDDETVTFVWEKIEGVTDYFVTYGDDAVYLKGDFISFAYNETSAFTIKAIGGGYYLSSETKTISAQEIKAFPAPTVTTVS